MFVMKIIVTIFLCWYGMRGFFWFMFRGSMLNIKERKLEERRGLMIVVFRCGIEGDGIYLR